MNINKLTGIIVTAVGVIYSVLAYTLPRASIGKPMDPIIFPLALGICMTLCGILMLATMGKEKDAKESKAIKKPSSKGISLDGKLIIFTCAMGILYGILFEPLGYVLSTIIFMGALLFAINDGLKKWKTNILVAIGFSVVIYVIFSYLLNIPLPMMPIFEI
ncbi:Tripartite tricarboxylate transporter TctB family [Desulfosporosinus orientis DSM 765]|uniref:Tripartite tricarboxylate transporter TctB family n=1 Tax=Desulfosporosinus orientis (strain ATCC 19365 / DSM 765 / NCIMB 8382 / VKM B-1628 / Singapore I) TaxID=768706 RepID=G7W717_DESOD|nr:tripartite tricarboxylate transporter TctB family protein [Desulfosporosinus orientis]AET69874.1 Tripartite tricarboxylate transporter TctB family [Desulfosporosinus orientis DSM 765]